MLNMMIMEGDIGFVIIDILMLVEIVCVVFELYFEYCLKKFIKVIIYMYFYVDYYGGVVGLISKEDVIFGKVVFIGFEGFMEVVVSENIFVGNVMICCVEFMYGSCLLCGELG